MEIRTFRPADLHAIRLQMAQTELLQDMLTPGYGEALQQHGPCYTATRFGEVMACIGVVKQWDSYGRAWALLSQDVGSCMLALTRGVRRWLRFHNPGRIDTAVDCNFAAAVRWAELLGFEREGIMRRYTPDGRDCYLYAQVV